MIKLEAKRFELNFLLKLSDLKSNLTLTLSYLNPALNNPGLVDRHSRTLTAVAGWKQNSDKTASLANVSSFRKKTSYIARVVIGRKNVLYQSAKHGDELKLSRHLPILIMPDHIPDFTLAFFRQLEGKFRNKWAGK